MVFSKILEAASVILDESLSAVPDCAELHKDSEEESVCKASSERRVSISLTDDAEPPALPVKMLSRLL